MPTDIPPRVHLKRLAPAIVSGLVVSFAFVAFFTSALHDPRPNALTVGIVGSPAAAAQTQRELDQALPGGFAVTRYSDEAAARAALHAQDADGVLRRRPGRGCCWPAARARTPGPRCARRSAPPPRRRVGASP